MHDHTKYALRCGLNEQDSPMSACAVEAKPGSCFNGRDPVCRRAPSSSTSAIWKSASRRKMARALGTSVRSTVAAPAACRSSLPARHQHSVGAHPRESGRRWHVLGAAACAASSPRAPPAAPSCACSLSTRQDGAHRMIQLSTWCTCLAASSANAASVSCAIKHTRGSMHGAGFTVRQYAR